MHSHIAQSPCAIMASDAAHNFLPNQNIRNSMESRGFFVFPWCAEWEMLSSTVRNASHKTRCTFHNMSIRAETMAFPCYYCQSLEVLEMSCLWDIGRRGTQSRHSLTARTFQWLREWRSILRWAIEHRAYVPANDRCLLTMSYWLHCPRHVAHRDRLVWRGNMALWFSLNSSIHPYKSWCDECFGRRARPHTRALNWETQVEEFVSSEIQSQDHAIRRCNVMVQLLSHRRFH